MANSNQQAFFELVRAGLWEKEARLSQFCKVDYEEVMCLAEEQSVVGLVTAGLEHVSDVKVPQEVLLQFIGNTLQIEQRNKEMNIFISTTVENMRSTDICCLLVKGSGLAQCYSKPLWRPCGDIDFFFSDSEYKYAINYLTPLSSDIFQDSKYTKSYGLVIDDHVVELHGTLRSGLSTRLDNEIDEVQHAVFIGGDVRSWQNEKTQVFLPGVDSDLFLLFTHFVRHFYQNEFVLRQVCDWCRFLWTFCEKIDVGLLEKRLRRSGLMSEWKAFAAFVVDYLGMPVEAMPLFNENDNQNKNYKKKAEMILDFVFSEGKPNRVGNAMAVAKIFPINTFKFLPALLFNVNGKKLKERLFGK